MKEDKLFRNCVIGLLFLVVAAYSNHFRNSFHFDDSHCITNNVYVRSLSNIPEFFKSGKTFSSLPYNQTYRPMLTTMYAIDYAIGGGYAWPFHISIFLFFLLQGFFMYLLIIKVVDSSFQSLNNKYFALFATAWYMLATANADTINYVSSSSDSISTFWVIVGLVIYIYRPEWRNKFLYLIPVIIGAFFKQTAIIFPALLAVYVFLFENKDADRNVVRKIFRTALTIIPALIECIVLYRLQAKLTPQTYITGGSTFNYIITQPFVILHYFITFFFPFDLSADSDWVPLASIASAHFLIGMAFVVMLFVIAFTLLRNIKYSPIVFGIAWFLIALIPSTFIPLAEVMNDHRAFFPYIGIAIAMGWIAFFIWERIESHYIKAFKATLVLVLILNAAGTFARNFVWHNEESLWYDVSLKSPNNGRGLMNYGLSLMAKRDYTGAETYYTKAIDLMPYYPYVYENMAILKAAQGQTDLADKYYKQALDLDSGVPILHYYYAKFLHEQGKDDDAITHLQKAIVLSTGDIDSRYLLMEIYKDEQNWPALKQAAIETLSVLPNDVTASNYLTNSVGGEYRMKIALDSVKVHPTATNYITLSLIYYGQKDYKQCIEASEKAISLDVNNYTAYNNMGSAYNMLGDWKNAADALDKALKLKPDFELAKNNYVLSLKEIAVTDSMNRVVQNNPTPENYINLSLLYYRQNLFLKSIDACKQALRLNPSYTLAYNNMCAAYNKLKMWDEAIDAGTNAMRLEPNNQLVKNNLAEARKGKEGIRN